MFAPSLRCSLGSITGRKSLVLEDVPGRPEVSFVLGLRRVSASVQQCCIGVPSYAVSDGVIWRQEVQTACARCIDVTKCRWGGASRRETFSRIYRSGFLCCGCVVTTGNRQRTVLVVDHDLANHEVLTALLEAEGNWVSAGDVDQAVELLSDEDVALLDVNMPGQTGFSVCRAFRARPETGLPPIVLATGLNGVQGSEAGFDGFPNKPNNRVELFARVRSLVRLKQYTNKLKHSERAACNPALRIEAKDPHTEAHCDRLRYPVRLAKRLGLSDEDLVAFRRAGIVHDIGKVAGVFARLLGSVLFIGWFNVVDLKSISPRLAFIAAFALVLCGVPKWLLGYQLTRGLLTMVTLFLPTLLGYTAGLDSFFGTQAGPYAPEFDMSLSTASTMPFLGSLFSRIAGALERRNTENEGNESDLQARGESLRLLIESVQDYAIFELDPAGRVTSWNAGAERITGYRPDEIIGRHYSCLYIPEDQREGTPMTHLAAAAKGNMHREGWRQRKDGSPFFADVVVTALHDKGGTLRGFAEITRDITERRLADRQLLVMDLQLRTAEMLAKMGSWSWDIATNRVEWSDNLYALFGVTRADIPDIPAVFMDHVHHDDRELVQTAISEALQNHQPFMCDFRVVLPQGSVRVHQVRGTVISDATGRPVKMYGFARDVTELVQATEAVRLSERRYRLLAEHVTDVIWTTDMKGNPTFVSPSVTRHLGYTVEECLALTPVEILTPRSRRIASEAFAEILTSEREYADPHRAWRWQVEMIRKDGSTVWTEVTMTFLRDQDNRAQEVLGVSRDISDRIEAEEALRGLTGQLLRLQDQERRRLARELHDVTGQGLAAVSMNLTLVGHAIPPTDAKAHRILSDTLCLTNQCIREIRTLSYLLHPPLLDEEGLEAALHWYVEGLAERSGIKVDLQISLGRDRPPQEVEIVLFRIVQETLVNIHRHSGSATARIRIERETDQLRLEVSDVGRGIPLSVLHRANEQKGALGVGVMGMHERVRQLGAVI